MKIDEIIKLGRELAMLLVLVGLAFRVAFSDFSLSLGSLSATDIVAMLLAFFAIALSAAFYFKSSEASSQFYDNMHKFTQDTSVILGKIESKFGEQLRSIEQKSADLKASVDRYYENGGNKSASDKEQKETKEEVEETRRQYDEIIENIFSKTRLDAAEKEKLKDSLRKKESKILELQSLISESANEEEKKLRPRVQRYMVRRIRERLEDNDTDEFSPEELFLDIIRNAVGGFKRDINKIGYISTTKPSSDEDITEKGLEVFMAALEEALNEE